MLDHDHIGTEHILLGLIREDEGVAAKALELLNISLEAVRRQVEEIIGQGQQAPSGDLPFTPRAKKVLDLSVREAPRLDHDYIGTEHILLGLIRDGDSVAAQVLVKLGANLNRVRQQVILLLSGYRVRRDKESAIDAQNFEKAKALRDQERELLATRSEYAAEWKNLVLEVDEHLIEEACAELVPRSVRGSARRSRPTLPPEAAAALVAADAEIWGMV